MVDHEPASALLTVDALAAPIRPNTMRSLHYAFLFAANLAAGLCKNFNLALVH